MTTGRLESKMRRRVLAASVSALALVSMTRAAWAAPGDRDPTFGGGFVTTDVADDDLGFALVIQPDGKLVVAGQTYNGSNYDIAVARYNADGSLDPTFGSDGIVITDVDFGSFDEASALVLQGDGKLVVAGLTYDGSEADIVMVRYNADGSLDPMFDSDGIVTVDVGSGWDDRADALILQPDGKLVAAGYSDTGNRDFALVRCNADGSLDASFGSGGKVTTALDIGNDDRVYALLRQPDGKLIAAGESFGADADFALVRYDEFGVLDNTFGSGGIVITDVSGFYEDESANALVRQSDGKLVVAGDSKLVRYDEFGVLDPSFSNDGKVALDFFAQALVLQPDGKLVAAGYSTGFAMARYNANGSVDSSFGNAGTVTTVLKADSLAYGLALAPDGKLVAAGIASLGDVDFAVARYNGDGTLDPTFNPGIVFDVDLGILALTQQADGKLLAAGGDASDAALARYLADGSRDPAFGTGGLVLSNLGGVYELFDDVIELSDGKLLAAGQKGTPSGSDFVLARYFANGLSDGTFGSGGVVVTDFGHPDEGARKVLQVDDKILAIGYTDNTPALGDFALARYTSAGALDTTFGSPTGKVTTDFGGTLDFAESAALQPDDGKIVVVGQAITLPAFAGALAVARYQPDGTLDSSFATGGKLTLSVLADHDSADVVIEPDGKIVVSSTGYDGGGTPYQVLVRLTDTGTLDASFGSGGVAVGPVGNGRTLVRAGSGTYLVAGDSDPSFDPLVGAATAYKLVRYRSDGALDASFGSGGIVIVPVEGEVYGDLILQADGKAVLAGDDYSTSGAALVRLQTSYCHAPDPTAGCATAAKSQLQWQRPADPTKRKLAFKWGQGDETLLTDLDDPTTTSTYSLCVADDDGLALLSSVPAAGTCDGQPCWEASPSGYGYKDKSASNDGVFRIKLKTGAAGKAKALVKGKGANVAAGDGQALSGTVSAVLVNEENGYCAAATFSGAQIDTNDTTSFKAKAP